MFIILGNIRNTTSSQLICLVRINLSLFQIQGNVVNIEQCSFTYICITDSKSVVLFVVSKKRFFLRCMHMICFLALIMFYTSDVHLLNIVEHCLMFAYLILQSLIILYLELYLYMCTLVITHQFFTLHICQLDEAFLSSSLSCWIRYKMSIYPIQCCQQYIYYWINLLQEVVSGQFTSCALQSI